MRLDLFFHFMKTLKFEPHRWDHLLLDSTRPRRPSPAHSMPFTSRRYHH